MPQDIPEYRQQRGHLDFVANAGVPAAAVKGALKAAFEVTQENKNIDALEEKYLNEFLDAKQTLVHV
jgi:hypothetical protein